MEKLAGNLEEHLQELCLRIGGRHAGSPQDAAAANYIEKVFRSYGYETVRESYPVVGWEFKSFQLFNMTKGRAVPAAVPCYFSNGVEAEGKLLWLHRDDLDKLDSIPVAGRICMVEFWMKAQSEVFGVAKVAEDLDKHGAKAAIFISALPPYSHGTQYKVSAFSFPECYGSGCGFTGGGLRFGT